MARKTKFGGEPPVPQKVQFEAKNYWEREEQRRIDIMYCGRGDLVGESFVIRTMDEMDDKLLCPDCKTELKQLKEKDYKCPKCEEPWIVTFLPRVPEFPNWPSKGHWQEMKESLEEANKKRRKK